MTHPQRTKLLEWGRPLPPGEDRDRWIDCVLDLIDIEDREGRPHITSHWVFCRKVLHEGRDSAAIAGRFQNTALTREAMHLLADEWWEPTREVAA